MNTKLRKLKRHTEALSSIPPLTISLPLLETTVTFIFKTKTHPLHQTVSATHFTQITEKLYSRSNRTIT
jgi:hypothetical protein